MEQRQVKEMDVFRAEVFILRANARASKRVRMRPEHRLGTRGRSGRALKTERHPLIAGTRGERCGMCIHRIEQPESWQVVAGRCAIVRVRHTGAGNGRYRFGHEADKLRLRDRADGAAVFGKIGQLVQRRLRIGRHGDLAGIRASELGDDRFRTVIDLHQHPLAGLDAAHRKTRRKRRS